MSWSYSTRKRYPLGDNDCPMRKGWAALSSVCTPYIYRFEWTKLIPEDSNTLEYKLLSSFLSKAGFNHHPNRPQITCFVGSSNSPQPELAAGTINKTENLFFGCSVICSGYVYMLCADKGGMTDAGYLHQGPNWKKKPTQSKGPQMS